MPLIRQRSTSSHPAAPMPNAEGLVTLPSERIPDTGIGMNAAYELISSELLLDGQARLNLATFVTTWMPSSAAQLMAETANKNMIDKDEYPQTARIESHCVNMLADLWSSPEHEQATGCSTTGSSEACMLGGLALNWRWRKRRSDAGQASDRPNLVMGANVQVCWEKFCRYWDVEPRMVPMAGNRFHLSAEEAAAHCDANTIGVVAILGSTFEGSYEPVKDICAALDTLQDEHGLDIPVCSRSTRPATSTASSTQVSAGRSGATPMRSRASWCSTSTTSAATCPPSR
jgi:glutamate decarboxylase